VGKAIVPMCFFLGGYERHGKLEGLFAWAVMGSTGVNGLRKEKTG